ncbi:hypothetical protein P8452_72607 [Trifolium repens]|nr:hypothetical protein P8452_72607 [Trifolium repens]
MHQIHHDGFNNTSWLKMKFLPQQRDIQKNLDTAKASLEVLTADRQFLRDWVTISQVAVARVECITVMFINKKFDKLVSRCSRLAKKEWKRYT